jgi:hypothetical protein
MPSDGGGSGGRVRDTDLGGDPDSTPSENFDGEITVSSSIIDQLSSGLYETSGACLKELINNSYDADATTVTMSVRPDADVIVISDNGDGITRADFERHFRRIARSHKRDDSDVTGRGRPKIGKIGIGFIAANEICDQMDIVSTVRGSEELLEVSINFAEMRTDPEERRRKGEDLAKADYTGQVYYTAARDDHYTQLFLREVKGEARDFLRGAKAGRRPDNLYGLKPDTIRDRLADNLASWTELDSYSRTMLEIALNVPVRYHDRWLPGSYRSRVQKFTDRATALDFEVIMDGTELRKPIVLTSGPDGKSLLKTFRLDGQYVGADGYLYSSSGRLQPRDLNGILIRIRNAAAGEYDRSFLDYPSWIDKLFQGWVSCEVYADERLEPALNIDRRTLRPTDDAYVELRGMLHAELSSFFKEVRRELYQKRSARRRQERAEQQSEQLDDLGDRLSQTIGKAAAEDVVNRLRQPTARRRRRGTEEEQQDSLDVRTLTAKYSPTEILELVTDAAAAVGLDAASTRRLLSEIATRFHG